MKTVKLQIYAGGAWEGHVVYAATNPFYENDISRSSRLSSVADFCAERDLGQDEEFNALVKRNLVFETGKGFVIPPEKIDPTLPISSATDFLKKAFHKYAA